MPDSKKPKRGFTNAQLQAAQTAKQQSAFEVFYTALSPYFPDITRETPWLQDLFKQAQPYLGQGITADKIPDVILNSGKAPKSFTDRFSGIFKLKDLAAKGVNIAHIPTVAEYSRLSNEMDASLRAVGLNDLANNETIGNIIGNNVDFTQFQQRLDNAFFAVDNADQALKDELAKNFPQIQRTDLAKALLAGPEGAQQLEKTIAQANVRAAASRVGLTNVTSPEEIYRSIQSGVTTQADVQAGYAKTAQELAGVQNAANLFGDQSNVAAELEKQNVLNQNSNVVKRLKSQARAEYAGSTGATQGSLSRVRAGAI